MDRILVIGCGDIARRAIPLLVPRFRVFALVRRPRAMAAMRALGAVPLHGDLDDRRSLARLAGIADAVLYFAPPPPAGKESPRGDERDMQDTRTRHFLAALGNRRSLPQRLIYISTTGVYGDCGGALIDETRPCRASSARARRRLDAERRLRAFGRRRRVAVAVLRAPGIYAADRLPIERLARGDPVPADEIFTGHIHADDLARLTVTALFRARAGRVYNAVDDSRLPVSDYFDLVADACGLPRPARMPWTALAAHLPPGALSFMKESRRIGNARLGRELGFRLRYPTVAHGLADVRPGPGRARFPLYRPARQTPRLAMRELVSDSLVASTSRNAL
ncbi:MAG: NAD-dependent epimerase/dehydratase family protein [Azoarcus sp.]|nr:NAD-dependent epimerase/dehydratase family protein [Azoarcus sp.]